MESVFDMRKKCFFRILFLSLVFGTLTAFPQEPPRIRAGVVSSAKFTSEKPGAESQSPVSRKFSPAWAILTVTLDPGRALSIFDYTLRKDGSEFKCLDLAEGSEPFKGTVRTYRSMEAGKKSRLVFAVPSADAEYEMLFKLIPGQERPVKLNAKPPPPPPAPAPTEEAKEADSGKK